MTQEPRNTAYRGTRRQGVEMEAWHAAVHRVAKSRTRLSDCTELGGFFYSTWYDWGH